MAKEKSHKLTLSLPDPLYQRIQKEKNKYSYSTMQECINDILRDTFFKEHKKQKSSLTLRGRPRKINSQYIIARKRIFSKDGVIVPY